MLDNAVLTEIRGPGTLDAYGDPADDGPVLWSGRAAGYLKRTRKSVLSGGAQVDVKTDVFWLLDSAGAPVLQTAGPDWEAATVVIEDRRVASSPVTRRYTVNAMEHRQAGTPVDNLRLELDADVAA